MHNGEHVSVSEGRRRRPVINREMGVRHRVTVVRAATGVLVHDMDEVAFPEVSQEPFRVAPAAGNGAAALGVHVDRMALHRYRNVAAMEAKVGGKPWPPESGAVARLAVPAGELE